MGLGNDKNIKVVPNGSITTLGTTLKSNDPKVVTSETTIKWYATHPLIIKWEPKEDIDVWELAQSQELLVLMARGPVMPHQVNHWCVWLRHFNIIDPNKKD